MGFNSILSLFLITIATRAFAHSNLGYPLPYSPIACKPGYPWCNNTCPPIWHSGRSRARNSPFMPAATWKRGQKVSIIWHKNNHRGGFYRRSLVPVKHMYNKTWHDRAAFDWGCFSQGSFKCTPPGTKTKLCGGDQYGRAYKSPMTVPAVFPDGDYVLSHLWIGGLHWDGDNAHFPDYYACSFVRIQGEVDSGNMSTELYKPQFHSGVNEQRPEIPRGKCRTGKLYVGECGGFECKQRTVINSIPGPFLNGKSPPPVRRSLFTPADLKHGMLKSHYPSSSAIESMVNEKIVDDKLAKEEQETSTGAQKVAPEEQRASNAANKVAPKPSNDKQGAPDIVGEEAPSTATKYRPANTKMQRPTRRKKNVPVKEEATVTSSSPPTASFVSRVIVFVNGRAVKSVAPDARSKKVPSLSIKTMNNTSKVTFEALTTRRAKYVKFEIAGRKTWTEYSAPYVYFGNRRRTYNFWKQPIYNRWFQLTIAAMDAEKRIHTTKVYIYMKKERQY